MKRQVLSATMLLATALAGQTVRTIVNNGPTSNRYDVVILGDGYRDVEQSRFDSDCLVFAQALFNKDPYRTFARYFNVHTVFRASRESGADHPDANPPIYRDTAYDASYNTGGTPRCLYIHDPSLALADAALAPANEGRILVLVNDSRYGGCGGQFAVSYNGTSMTEVQIHEMGHSVGGLADEYWYAGARYSGPEPSEPNATTSSAGSKWSHWIGSNGVNVFEGCRYNEFGLYRPLDDCLLRSLGRPHCSVCAETLVLRAHQSASAIDAPLPAGSRVVVPRPASQAFSFTNIAPPSSNVSIDWRLDGVVVASGVTSVSIGTAGLSVGDHVVSLRVKDNTPLVRRDPLRLLDQQHDWVLAVTDPTLPDLRITALAPSATSIRAGSLVDLDTTELNAGPQPAAAHAIGHYLSTDAVIGFGDLALGSAGVAGLGGQQSTPVRRTAVAIPAFIAPGSYWIGAVADVNNQVAESDETNNVLVVPVQILAPTCGVRLEYTDPGLYPRDSGSISLAAPIRLLEPALTSPCDAGQPYLMVWGCSGTAPGTPFGSFTLPLNLDACSLLSMSARTVFINFWGVLDGRGVGRAVVLMPPGLPYSGDLTTHVAGLVWDGGSFAPRGVSNAVRLRLTR